MANTLNNTLNKVGEAIEEIFGTKRAKTPIVYDQNGQSCLEKFGMETRNEHLFRNTWKRGYEYTRALVNAEYNIQTEFKVSSKEDQLKEEAIKMAEKQQQREIKNAQKQEAKKLKKEERERKKNEDASKVKGGLKEDEPQVPKETLKQVSMTLQAENAIQQMRNVKLT